MAKKDREDMEQDDIEIRTQKLKQQAEKLTAGQITPDKLGDYPAEVEEQFWKNVVAFEQATWSQPFQILLGLGISLPSPDELADTELGAKLWEVINALALVGVYLDHTDHLSDRELYAQLWDDSLREEMVLQPNDANFACHIDMIGSGSEEDNKIYLKYYADGEERSHWAKEWADEPVPSQERLPFDRDRHLPQSNLGLGFGVH